MSKPFNGAISAFFETEAPADIRQAIMAADKDEIINPTYPYPARIDRGDYEDQLAALLHDVGKPATQEFIDDKMETNNSYLNIFR